MNFLNLRYFIVAAEEMNFTKAAKKLYISQQSLSNHIAKLEEYFGVQLFDRGTPLTLTPAGQSLLKNAQMIIRAKNQAELELQDIKDFKSADLTIGVPNTRGALILPPLLTGFHQAFPQVRLHLFEGTSKAITDALYNGKIDFTLGFALDDPDNVCTEILQEEHTLIVVPKNILRTYFTENECASLLRRKALPIETFARCPFVRMKQSNWIGAVFENCFQEAGLEPVVVLETSNVMTMLSLCMEGLGVIICPKAFLRNESPVLSHEKAQQVTSFILDYPPAHKMIAVNYLKRKYQTQAAKEFIKITKSYFRANLSGVSG